MILDLKLLYFLNNLTGKSLVFDTFIIFLASYLQYILVLIFLVLLCFSVYSKTQKVRMFWVVVVSIVVARFGVTEFIRLFYHRLRPFLVYKLNPLVIESEWSFPSGHSAFFFAMAMAIYLYNRKWGIWFFVGAVLMNLSRIVAGVHYPSDIVGGGVVGVVVAYVVFRFLGKRATGQISQFNK